MELPSCCFHDRGWECLLGAFAWVAFEPNLTGVSVRTIEMVGGIFGATATTDDILDALTISGGNQ